MSLVHINKNPSTRELKWFGVLFLCFFGLVAAVLRWRYNAGNAATMVLGAALLLTGVYFALPRLRRKLYLGWMYVTMPIGMVVSIILLAIVYFLVVTPIGVLVRLFSHDPMMRRFDPAAQTYWTKMPPTPRPDRYFRQF